jgi:hypothetical protein
MRSIASVSLLVLVFAIPATAQDESRLAAEFRKEGAAIRESCGEFSFKSLLGCAVTLATDQPMHVALGNLAPQNGFGFGAAFVDHYTPNENWRLSWNVDGVAATSGSWRTGVYMKMIRTTVEPIGVTRPGTQARTDAGGTREYPVINLYAQAISLEKLYYFGAGQDSTPAGKSVFSEKQTIVGSNATWPLPRPAAAPWLRTSLIGAVNGRFVDVKGNTSESVPSIEVLYNDLTAPGLSSQPGFAQFEEGIRVSPRWLTGRVQGNYLVDFQQFVAGSDSHSSFHRWTVDLKHDFPLYSTAESASTRNEINGPDECLPALGADRCPPVSLSRNRGGTVGFRFLVTESTASDPDVVPFYFQPTLGGSDINGATFLNSYEDYRFRGPKLIAFQESVEHSIWGPVGFTFLAEQGRVAQQGEDLDLSDLKHSFLVGLTLRAGGFPQIAFTFAWGGSEGHHTSAVMMSELLGGSSRPSLY